MDLWGPGLARAGMGFGNEGKMTDWGCRGVGQQGGGRRQRGHEGSTAKHKVAGKLMPNSVVKTYLQVQDQTK